MQNMYIRRYLLALMFVPAWFEHSGSGLASHPEGFSAYFVQPTFSLTCTCATWALRQSLALRDFLSQPQELAKQMEGWRKKEKNLLSSSLYAPPPPFFMVLLEIHLETFSSTGLRNQFPSVTKSMLINMSGVCLRWIIHITRGYFQDIL